MSLVLGVLAKTFEYEGRAGRKEYWLYSLCVLSVGAVLLATELYLGKFDPELGMGPLTGLLFALNFLPMLSVTVRRLHDIDKSGWWHLVVLIPLAGPIIMLVFAATKGTHGDNFYGPDPLNQDSAVSLS